MFALKCTFKTKFPNKKNTLAKNSMLLHFLKSLQKLRPFIIKNNFGKSTEFGPKHYLLMIW